MRPEHWLKSVENINSAPSFQSHVHSLFISKSSDCSYIFRWISLIVSVIGLTWSSRWKIVGNTMERKQMTPVMLARARQIFHIRTISVTLTSVVQDIRTTAKEKQKKKTHQSEWSTKRWKFTVALGKPNDTLFSNKRSQRSNCYGLFFLFCYGLLLCLSPHCVITHIKSS